MSAVEKIESNLVGLSLRLQRAGAVGGTGGHSPTTAIKGFGDPPPPLADISKSALLMSLFALQGLVGRLKRKLIETSGKPGRIIPAKGLIASAGEDDMVYLGVEFLQDYHQEEETVAGVLAHEWGHLVSRFTEIFDPNELNWDQIASIRQEEECRADAYAGRLLQKMGYSPEGLIGLLTHPQLRKESQKYHPPQIRAQIIRRAFLAEQRSAATGARLQLFKGGTTYANPFRSRLIATA